MVSFFSDCPLGSFVFAVLAADDGNLHLLVVLLDLLVLVVDVGDLLLHGAVFVWLSSSIFLS